MTMEFLANKTEPKKEPDCKGIFFRGARSFYRSPGDGSFVATLRMRPLKSMSCPGCMQCDSLTDDLVERMSPYWPGGFIETTGLGEVQHGKTYRLMVTNVSKDWESGVVDDWDVEFVEVNPDGTRKEPPQAKPLPKFEA